MTKEEYFGGWLKVIDKDEMDKVLALLDGLYGKYPIWPLKENVFKAFRLCPYEDLKVVMIGQDPYPQPGVATGILFGNNPNTSEENLSPSLKVIKEAVLNPTIPHGVVRFDNSMESWAKQGILMINSALTVEANRIGSHTMYWRQFISKMLTNLSMYSPGLIYVLYGAQAKTFRPYINSSNMVFEVPHPAYFARTGQRFETTMFDEINVILKRKNNTTINWYEKVL